MKLYEFGEGIFRTHVTWDELQRHCQDLFGEEARFGSNKTISCIGDGRGFLSKMCLIDPDFPAGISAPKKFIVKICTQVTMLEVTEKMKDKIENSPFSDPKMMEMMTASVKKVHNTECSLYEILGKQGNESLRIPKVYYSQKFSEENPGKGYLIMEFIEGAVNINMYDNIPVEDLKQALRAVAALEAISLDFTEEEWKLFDINPYVELFGPIFADESIKSMVQMFRQYAEPELKEKVDKFEKCLPEIIDLNYAMQIGEDLKIPKVLVHGDMWSTNILWKNREPEGYELAAVVDFQTAHLGTPAVDLVRLMGACLSGKERQEQSEHLIEEFYGYFLEELKGTPAPYTLEQLKESVNRFYPLGGFLLVPMIGPLFEMNHMNADEESKAKVREAILEKSEALLDDIFKGVEHNRTVKAQKNAAQFLLIKSFFQLLYEWESCDDRGSIYFDNYSTHFQYFYDEK